MEHRKIAIVLLPSELLYEIDADWKHIFLASNEHGAILLRPFTSSIKRPDTDSNLDYCKGFLMGMSEGYHKGYSDAMAYEELRKSTVEANDAPADASACKECPYYDDFYDACKRS